LHARGRSAEFRKAWVGPYVDDSAKDIALANDLDREADVDRRRYIIFAAGEPRQLTPTLWDLFTLLCRRREAVACRALIHPQYTNLHRLAKLIEGPRYVIVNR